MQSQQSASMAGFTGVPRRKPVPNNASIDVVGHKPHVAVQVNNYQDETRSASSALVPSTHESMTSRSESHHNRQGEQRDFGSATGLWRPFWLRKAVLLGFSILYAALLTATVLVKYLFDKHNGFHIAKSTSYYTWTYGPTAVLVIVAGLWRQVDYHCKALSPWSQLHRGPGSASRTVLLDLVSPFPLVSFYKAARLGDVSVMATIIGWALIKIIVRP
jgi:hypothetical protein